MIQAQLHLVETLDDFLDMRQWLGEQRDWLGYDIETTGLNVGRDRVRTLQLGDAAHGWTVPWDDWKGGLREVLNAYDRRMVAHNSLFDSKFLKREGFKLKTHLLHDSMIMAHLNDPMSSIALKSVTKRFFGPSAVAGQAALDIAKSKQGWTWETVPIDFPAYWAYGALDTILTAMLADKLWSDIQSQRLIYDIELAFISVMCDAELKGMAVDLDYSYSKEAELRQAMDEARPHIPEEIKNPGSDQQVISYLQRVGARLWKTTDKGNLSCDDDVMKEQEEAGIPGAAELRKWRRAKWLINSYFSNIRELNVDGVLRPSVKPTGARTGRMSVVQPALQTVPRGSIVRDAFVAREGEVLLSADYDQLELRVLAHCAEEERMLEAIRRGEDLHDATARDLFGDGFTKAQRQICKNANFAAAYVSGVPTFARTAGIPIDQAQAFMDKYHSMYPGISQFHKKVINDVIRDGYVLTEWGRRIPVPERNAAYKGVNYKIQSTATADLIKYKIVELSNAGLHDMFRLPIHDEVLMEVPKDIALEVKHEVDNILTETQLFRCPLTASGDLYRKWGDKSRDELEGVSVPWEPVHEMVAP